jgi:hypothetical protein
LAKEEYPELKLDKLRKADKITAEVSSAKEAQDKLETIAKMNFTDRKLSGLWNYIKETDFMHLGKSSSAARGNTKDAIRNLMALDRTLESSASKTARESMPVNIPQAGRWTKIIGKNP